MISCMAVLVACLSPAAADRDSERALEMDRVPGAMWRFEGEVGRRVDANLDQWLLRAPDANPGMLDMFRRRDREWPYAQIVPWAGEFAGKYLISGVQALSMTDDPRLRTHLDGFVAALCDTQAEDGYLGPFRKDERLLGHWDLWGHYHVMQGLLLWYDAVGDERALDTVLRAAELIAQRYGASGRRPIEAGAPECNLAIYHVMADLYRRTGDAAFAELIARIEADMAEAGDWLNAGAEGVPYYKLRRNGTRWESLHIVQGFVERFRQTGDARYRDAADNLWKSIRDFDRHPSGAFTTNEAASGTIYAAGAIETCCSVAWMALSVDVLRLTGDPRVADELELTFYNQVLAAQHPSGSWCTYDTPINGVRSPSYHQINFQWRPGAPELNCCSVNAPRGLGFLRDWAVMRKDGGVAVNFYGPGRCAVTLADGSALALRQETGYPVTPEIAIDVEAAPEQAFPIYLRIPAWSAETRVAVNGEPAGDVASGSYLALERSWRAGDRITLALDFAPRSWAGQLPSRYGTVALFRGPLLLAFDAGLNEIEPSELGRIDPDRVALRPVADRPDVPYPPMGLWEIDTDKGAVRVCDFASAGARGTEYAAWLPAANPKPPAVELTAPERGERGRPGPVALAWTAPAGDPGLRFDVEVARDEAFTDLAFERRDLADASGVVVPDGALAEGTYYWRVIARNDAHAAENAGGPGRLVFDVEAQPFLTVGPDGELAASELDGDPTPTAGRLADAAGLRPCADRRGVDGGALAFDGETSSLSYDIALFPARDYAFQAWIRPEDLPAESARQVCSAWCAGMDDPLRVTVEGDAISARMETAGRFYATPGAPIRAGEWVHVAAVKAGERLTLYVGGAAVAAATVPEQASTRSRRVGIGFNPLWSGGERFAGAIDAFSLVGRAYSAEELAAFAK